MGGRGPDELPTNYRHRPGVSHGRIGLCCARSLPHLGDRSFSCLLMAPIESAIFLPSYTSAIYGSTTLKRCSSQFSLYGSVTGVLSRSKTSCEFLTGDLVLYAWIRA